MLFDDEGRAPEVGQVPGFLEIVVLLCIAESGFLASDVIGPAVDYFVDGRSRLTHAFSDGGVLSNEQVAQSFALRTVQFFEAGTGRLVISFECLGGLVR